MSGGDNDWQDRYQALVLAHLEGQGEMLKEQANSLKEISEQMHDMSKQQALDRQSLENFKDYTSQQIKGLHGDIHNERTGLINRVSDLEDSRLSVEAVSRYKKWLIGVMMATIVTFIGNIAVALISAHAHH